MENKESNRLKEIVKETYAEIANQSKGDNDKSCCGAGGCCDTIDYAIMSEKYDSINGYHPDADLGLGCGLPTEFAKIKPGDTVIDLGSGAGNDCFVARAVAGESGKIIGVDMTEAMIAKAKSNAEKLGFTNVEFRLGDIEDLPMAANKADVVVSNCVLNLVPDKNKAFKEIFRVLKPKGHFSISDIVLKGELPAGLRTAAEMYAGCVAGALQKEDYLNIISDTGFQNITLQKEKPILIPEEILLKYISSSQIEAYKASESGIYSVTVYAEKPESNCCAPGTGCC